MYTELIEWSQNEKIYSSKCNK